MLILLPPSEGKAAAGDGPPLDLATLSLPEINGARAQVLEELEELCAGPAERARTVLGLSARQMGEVERDRSVRTAATLPACRLYTGVLYDALRLPELLAGDSAAVTRASVVIFSGLWGVVTPEDHLPPYRLSMGVKLPRLGGLGAFWRGHLSEPLTKQATGQLIVDCRSAAYAAAFKPDPDTAGHSVSVRVCSERVVNGETHRSVVSHMAKATRGAVAHDLLAARVDAETPQELSAALHDLGYRVELGPPPRHGTTRTMDVIVAETSGGGHKKGP
ncbi:peroxide stress protein YaaA [Salinactinospora qingdaonensis]|uniref:Peroxide stress protein YaaA n=1 Tax=Salinactinospora qingdaonensis TaxID=702744 RepID=A0ABP7ES86_9ACTN